MNAPIKFAQVSSNQGTATVHVIKLVKPLDGQALTVKTGYEGKVRIDFSGIADERISIVRVGETAVIYFHNNKSTITLDPFFGSDHWPLANLEFELGPNRVFGAQEIAALLPFTIYQGILPAADGSTNGNEQDSGANFTPANVENLPPILLNDLMPPEALGPIDFRADIGPAVDDRTPIQSGFSVGGIVEEEHLVILRAASPTQLSQGNEDTTSSPDADDNPDTIDGDDDTPGNFNQTRIDFTGNTENGQSLNKLISGGNPPFTFSFNDVTGDPVKNTSGVALESQGDPLFFHRFDANTLIGFADEDGNGTFDGAINDDGTYGDGPDRIVFIVSLDQVEKGAWTIEIYDQFDHPFDNNVESILGLNLTPALHAVDNDGDPLDFLGTVFSVGVIDDVPVQVSGTEHVSIDEDDISTPWSVGTSPYQGNTENNPGSVDPALVTGNLSDLFSLGADEHPDGSDKPSFRFINETELKAYMTSLGLASKQVAGANLPGIPLAYEVSTSGDWIILTAVEPDSPLGGPDTSNIVFELRLNQLTGQYEFRLFDELTHALPDGLPGGLDEILPIDFGQIIEAVDYDGDAAPITPGTFVIDVVDDLPEPAVKLNPLGVVQHDETEGVQPGNFIDFLLDPADSDTNSNAVKALFAHLETNAAVGDDPDADGDSNGGVTGNGPIGYARSLLPVVLENFLGSEEGADAPGTKTFSLSILDSASGLAVTDGSPIVLEVYDNGTPLDPSDDLIIGRVVGGEFDGDIAFAIDIDNDGYVSLAQYLSLEHPVPGSSHDESLDLGGKIGAVFTITDTDGDSVSTSPIDIGDNVRFDDDGPSVNVNDAVSPEERLALELELDETVGTDRYNTTEAPQDNNGAADDTPAPIVPIIPSQNPTSADAIGVRTTGLAGGLGSLFSVVSDFGTDGALPGDQNPQTPDASESALTFDLNGSSNGLTNLVATALSGTPLEGLNDTQRTIHLVPKAGSPWIIEGIVPGANGAIGGGDDYVAFRITILNHDDPANAQIQIEQFLAIDHDASEPSGAAENPENPSLFDEAIDLLLPGNGNNLQVVLTTTVTDGDDDTATDSDSVTLIDRNGSIVSFDDDGPKFIGVTPAGTAGPELLVNANFTAADNFNDPGNDQNIWGAEWGGFDSNGITGWTVAWSDIGGGNGTPRVERKGNLYLGMSTGNNLPMIDMAATPGNLQISQNVTAVDGATYILNFMAGAPEPDSAILQVIWNGDVVLTLDFTSGTLPEQMTEYTISVIADGAANTLTFKEVGSVAANSSGDNVGGNHGAYIANVSLKQSNALDDEDTTLSPATEIQGGPGDDGSGVVATGKINFDAGTDGLKSIVIGGLDGLTGIFVDNNGIGHVLSISQVWHAGEDADGNTTGYEQGGTLVGTMTHPTEGDQVAFTIEVDSDGNYVFTLVAPLNHPEQDDGNQQNGVETSWEDNLLIDFPITITDGDDDTATGTLSFDVDDDSPDAAAGISIRGSVVIDETANDDAGTGDNSAVVLPAAFSLFGAPIQKATGLSAAISDATVYGADGKSASISSVYGLKVAPGGVDSGLTTTLGDRKIFLFQEGDYVIGREGTAGGTANPNGAVAFAVAIHPATGVLTVAQYLAIEHDDVNDHNEANDDGTNAGDDAPDQPTEPQQQSIFSDAIKATLTVADGDGDGDTAEIGIGGQITFRDDGPTGAAIRIADGTLIHDETPGKQAFTDLLDTDPVTRAALEARFASVTDKGDDLDVAGSGAIGYAGDLLVFDASVNYGADGPGAATVYSFTLSQEGVFSGLKTTEGFDINLTTEAYGAGGTFIVGRVDGGADDGKAAFAIFIDPATGYITFAQYLSLTHDDINDHNEDNDDGSIGDDDLPIDNPTPVQQTLADGVLSVTVTFTDGDGDYTSASTDVSEYIIIRDDGPNAVDEVAREVDENGAQIDGNVLTNDSEGADGAALTHVKLPGSTEFVLLTSGTPLGGGAFQFPVAGVGTYTFTASGAWTFTPVATVSGNTSATFEYRLTDGDGDWDDAVQPITVLNSNSLPTAGIATAFLDDEGLINGIAGNGSNSGNTDAVTSAPEHTDSGFLPFNFNGETPGVIRLVDGTETVGGVNYTYDANPAGNSLTVKADGVDYMTVTLNQSTGEYTTTLLNPIKHPSNHSEDNVVFNIKYEVQDSSGDIATGTLAVDVDDDTPTAVDRAADVTEGGTTKSDVVLIIDRSGSMGPAGNGQNGSDPDGAGSYTSRMQMVKDSIQQLFESGAVASVFIVSFSSGATFHNSGSNGGWYTDLDAAMNAINLLQADGSTDYDAALSQVVSNFAPPPASSGGERLVSLFLSDGVPNDNNGTGSNGIDEDDTNGNANPGGEETDWINFLDQNDFDASYALGFGGLGNADRAQLEPIAWNGTTETADNPHDADQNGAGQSGTTDPNVIIVTNLSNISGLVSALIGAVGASAAGDVIDNNTATTADDSRYGADGPGFVSYLHVDTDNDGVVDGGEAVYTFNGTGYQLNGGAVQAGNSVTLATPDAGEMTFNFATGAWEYSTPDNVPSQYTENFNYKIKDGDGDESAAADLDITVHPLPTLAVSSPAAVAENAGHVQFTVSLSHALSTSPIPVTFSLGGGTATSVSDYGALEWSLTGGPADWHTGAFSFPANEDQVFVRVPIVNDGTLEPNETFQLTAASAGTSNPSAAGTATILDDTSDKVTISVNDIAVNEGGTATFTVTLTGAIQENVALNWATGGGTATPTADYAISNGTITFVPGGPTTIQVTVPVATDAVNDGGETFNVTLTPTDPVQINAGGSDFVGQATINNVVPNAAPTDIVFTGNLSLAAVTNNSGPGNDDTEIASQTVFTLSTVDPDDASGFIYDFNGSTTHNWTAENSSSETFTIAAGNNFATTSALDYDDGVQVTTATVRSRDPDLAGITEDVTVRLGRNDNGDTINGSGTTHEQVIYGFGGDDNITGGSDNDWISGGSGDDTITGGGGADVIDVGDGSDNTVRFTAVADYGDIIGSFDSNGGSQDQIHFTNALNALFDDVSGDDNFQVHAANGNDNNTNQAVNLNTTVELLFLDGVDADNGVTNANLTNAASVAAEFSAEFAITAAAGESALLLINDTDGNSASMWQYTEATGAAGGAGEIAASELTFIGIVHSDAAITSGNLDLA